MADDSIPLKIVAHMDAGQLIAENNRLQQSFDQSQGKVKSLEKQLQATAKVKVDPMASKMTSGTTGQSAMTAQLDAFAKRQKDAADKAARTSEIIATVRQQRADKEAYLLQTAARAQRLFETDAARSARSQPVGLSPAARAADTSRILDTVRQQQADFVIRQQQLRRLETARRMDAMLMRDSRGGGLSVAGGIAANAAMDEQKRINAAIRLHQIRKAEQAAIENGEKAQLARTRLVEREVDAYTKLQSMKQRDIPSAPIGTLLGGAGATLLAGAAAAGQRTSRWSEDVSKSSFTMAELELKLMNQADLTKKGAQSRIRMVGDILKATPSIGTLAGGVEMQTWLESAGLDKQSVESGRMLNVIAEGLVTLNAFGKDKGFTSDKESVRTLVGGAKAFGLGDDEKAVRRMSDVMSMGFKVSAMEAQHLPSFLKEASGYAALKMAPETAMGIFSTMVSQGMPAETASVALRNYGTKLAASRMAGESESDYAERTSKRGSILASLGVKDSQLQLSSENDVFTSLRTLNKALAGKSEQERDSAIVGLFGAENFAGIQMMLRDVDLFQQRAGEIADTKSLNKIIEQSRRHQAFSRQRDALTTEVADWESSVKIGTTWKDIESWQGKRYATRMANATTAGERFGISLEDVSLTVGNWFAKMFTTPEAIAGREVGAEAERRREELLERSARAAEQTAKNTMRGVGRNNGVELVPSHVPAF